MLPATTNDSSNGHVKPCSSTLVRDHRFRRGSKRARELRDRHHGAPSSSSSSAAATIRASDQETPPPPPTNFDVAYFHSYSHLGIHEEMIKVLSLSLLLSLAFLLLQLSPFYSDKIIDPYISPRLLPLSEVLFIIFFFLPTM